MTSPEVEVCAASRKAAASTSAWAAAAATAAAATATAAAVAGAHCWGRCAAIEASVEASALSPVQRSRGRKVGAYERCTSDHTLTHRAACLPRSEQLPEPPYMIARCQYSRAGESRASLHTDVFASLSHSSKVTELDISDPRRKMLYAAWHDWHVLSVAARKAFRQADRHARGVYLGRLVRAWRFVAARAHSQIIVCAAKMEKKRARRFVEHSMSWLPVVALLHRRRVLRCYQTLLAAFRLWRLRLALDGLRKRVAARDAHERSSRAIAAFSDNVVKTVAHRKLQTQQKVTMQMQTLHVLQAWSRVSKAFKCLENHCHATALRRGLNVLFSQVRLCRLAQTLSQRCAYQRLEEAFKVFRSSLHQTKTLRDLGRIQAIKLVSTAFGALRSWQEVSIAQRKTCTQLSWRHSNRRLLEVFVALRKWMHSIVTLQLLRRQRTAKLLYVAFKVLQCSTELRIVLKRVRLRCLLAQLRAAFQAFHAWSIRINKAKQILQHFRIMNDVSICQRAFGALKREVHCSLCEHQSRRRRERSMIRGAFLALHSHMQKSARTRDILQCTVMLKEATMRLTAFETFRYNVQLASILRSRRRQLEASILQETLRALHTWAKISLRMHHTGHQITSLRLKGQLCTAFSAWSGHTRARISRRSIGEAVATATARMRSWRTMRSWHATTKRALASETMLRQRILRMLQSVFNILAALATVRRKAATAARNCETGIAQRSIRQWTLTTDACRRVRCLPTQLSLSVRCCLAYWAYDCPAPALLVAWRLQAVHRRHLRRGLQFYGRNASKFMKRLLASWSVVASNLQAVQWRFKWHHALLRATVSLHAWSRHTRLIAAAKTRHAHCSRRLLRCTTRWWHFAVVERRAELQLQVGALRAWGFGAERCRVARDETIRGRWVDEVSEAFAMRRLLRLVLHGFASWNSQTCDVRTLRRRVHLGREGHAKGMAFFLWKQAIVCARLTGLDALLNSRSALDAIRRWRLAAVAISVASAHRTGLQRAVWQIWRAECRTRSSCNALVNSLERNLLGCATRRWRSYADATCAAEASARQKMADRQCRAALRTLRAHWHTAAKKAVLPRIMKLWRQAVRESRFARRHELRRGLRAWRAFGRERWTLRRRTAVAELLAARRHLRAAWLPWQLLCFATTPSHDVLVERWSDAATAPGVLRPLVGLQACTSSSFGSATAPLEKRQHGLR